MYSSSAFISELTSRILLASLSKPDRVYSLDVILLAFMMVVFLLIRETSCLFLSLGVKESSALREVRYRLIT